MLVERTWVVLMGWNRQAGVPHLTSCGLAVEEMNVVKWNRWYG
jgi:hypothetical protein